MNSPENFWILEDLRVKLGGFDQAEILFGKTLVAVGKVFGGRAIERLTTLCWSVVIS
jgi:hypothetical protein